MAEALLAFFLLILVWFFISKKKTTGDELASEKVIEKLQDTENIKAKQLSILISTHCDLEPAKVNEVLADIRSNERQLYKQIIQVYLNRDVEALETIDQHIDQLSEPYCKLLARSSESAVDTDKIKKEQQEAQQDKKDQQDKQMTQEEQQQAEQEAQAAQKSALSKVDQLSDEEKQSYDQWMRRVPDDPGGLLRRKFEQQAIERQRRPSNRTEQSGEPIW